MRQIALIVTLLLLLFAGRQVLASPNVFTRVLEASPEFHVEGGSGTAVCIRINNGTSYYLTCYHCVRNRPADKIFLSFGLDEKTMHHVQLGQQSPDADLAVVTLENGPPVHPVEISDEFPSVGDVLFGCGCPFGIPYLVNFGHMSCPVAIDLAGKREVMIVDLPIRPGMSGGPLCNDAGKLVGLMSAHLPDTNVGIAITAKCIKKFLNWK